MNQQGIRLQPEKIKAMLDIKPPKNKKYLQQFISMVNYYKEIFKKEVTYWNHLPICLARI